MWMQGSDTNTNGRVHAPLRRLTLGALNVKNEGSISFSELLTCFGQVQVHALSGSDGLSVHYNVRP